MAIQTDTAIPTTRADYDREGYAIFRKAISQDLVAECKEHVLWLMKEHPDRRPEQLGHHFVADDPFWVRLVSDPGLLKIAEQFIGPNIGLFASHYISKPPKDGQAVLWHQDGSYWPLEPMEVVTIWLAVDDSIPENGCMRVIPRSHLMELKDLIPNTEVANVLNSQLPDELVDESKAVNVVLNAGDVSTHHPNLIHGSKANHSDLRRAGLTIRYIPTTTKIADGNWPCAFLLQGEAVPGINAWVDFPKYVEGKHMPFKGCENWK